MGVPLLPNAKLFFIPGCWYLNIAEAELLPLDLIPKLARVLNIMQMF